MENTNNTINENNSINQINENTSVNVCCFHRYGKNDDLTKIFETINDFRTKYGLKFTHHKFYIYMIIKSDYLKELSQVLPFKISKFKTESHYICNPEDVHLITDVKHSFIRTTYDENLNTIIFKSKTNMAVHLKLIQKMFESLKYEFDSKNHTILDIDLYDTRKNTDNINNKKFNKIEIEGYDKIDIKESKIAKKKEKYINKKTVKKSSPILPNQA